nr:hypothetical protein [uncultured Sediminibacterium sp.]
MMIYNGQTAAVIHGLLEAMQSGKQWLGIDQSIQQVSKTDLHFFETHDRAIDFKEYNQQQQKEVALLPVELTYEYLVDRLREAHVIGQTNPSIKIEVDFIQGLYEIIKEDLSFAHLVEEMDAFDWSKVFYDPLEANTQAETFEDKVQFNRLEALVEALSAFAQMSETAQERIGALLHRYWDGEAMALQIEAVLQGSMTGLGKNIYTLQASENILNEPDPENRIDPDRNPLYDKDGNAFTDALIEHWEHQQLVNQKTNDMNMENLKYLKDNLKYTGFGDALHAELEKNITAKKNEFQLHFTTQVNNRPFDAVLDFRKSNTADIYFFNRYKATIEKSNGEKVSQGFQINKGKGVTAKQAYNLLQGRAVKREMTDAKGEEYQAWIQLDFDKKDEKGNFKVNKYNENYGYDLRDTIASFPVLELDGGEKEKDLLRSLEKGNAQVATIDNNGEQLKVFLEANPKYKTLNVYDEQFKMLKHEELPKLEKEQHVKQGQEVGEPRREVKQGKELKHTQKNVKGLISKKRVRNQQGVKI